jgi:TetR/AcrR family transcriptional repressor of nem operon
MNNTRDRILSHAEILVRSRGYTGFSYADLAAEIDIRKASIHHHFPSKGDLGTALIALYLDRFSVILAEIFARESTSRARLIAYAELYLDGVKRGLACLCGMLATEIENIPSQAREGLHAFFALQQAWLADVIREGQGRGEFRPEIAPEKSAQEILSALQGAMFIARALRDPSYLEAVSQGTLHNLTQPNPSAGSVAAEEP